MFEIDIPAVPNLLIWFATVGTILFGVVAFCGWLWSKFVADWLAGFTRNLARARALKIIKNADRVKQDRDNIQRFFINVLRAIVFLFAGSLLLVVGTIMAHSIDAQSFLQTIDDTEKALPLLELKHPIRRIFTALASIALTLFGFVFWLRAAWQIRDRVVPHADYSEYAVEVGERILRLLESAGMNENERASFINERWPTTGAEDDDPDLGPK